MRRGRPLRFLATTIGGWTAIRVALLWPPAAQVVAVAPHAGAAERFDAVAGLRDGVLRLPVTPWPELDRTAAPNRLRTLAPARSREHGSTPDGASRHLLALAALVRFGPAIATGQDASGAAAPGPIAPGTAPGVPPPLRPGPIAPGRGRLAGSAWLIARGGSNRDPLAGQLGGSQAGARLTYALDRGRRLALSARVAGPIAGGGGTEAAVGLDWQPTRAPLHLLVEQRVPLDGGRGGPAVLMLGGIGPVAVARGLRVEAYAQAGAVARGAVEGFGDGAARLTTPLGAPGGLRVDLGLGAWGGIQRGARRLDIGPTLGAAVPVGARAIRLTLDWRQRVAGNARPGSGPALSIGTDF